MKQPPNDQTSVGLPTGLDSISIRILEFAKDDFVGLGDLVGKIAAKATFYRHVNKLLALGCLRRRGSEYRTTETGVRALEQCGSSARPPAPEPAEGGFAALSVIPVPVYRAVLRLMLAAVSARWHKLPGDTHPNFVFFGAPNRWKTLLCRVICRILGLAEDRHIVLLPSESGKSLFARRDGTGAVSSRRNLLAGPFIAADEYHEADPSTRKALRPYLQGRLVIPLENDELDMRPVPALTLNPKKAGDLQSRTGLDLFILRRSVSLDVDRMDFPEAVRHRGREFLDRIPVGSLRKIPVPQAIPKEEFERIVSCLGKALDPKTKELNIVNFDLVGTLAGGYAAYVPFPEATWWTLSDYLSVVQTLGWVKPSWRECLPKPGPTEGEPRVTTEALLPSAEPVEGELVALDREALYQRWRKTHGLR